MTTESTPVPFGPEDRSLFGWVHQPEGRLSRATVILCPPLAREYFSTYYTYRVLARSLAERGITAIRFDYDGTGDAVGSDADADRVASYLESVRQAIGLARRLGTQPLALVGLRMGALLAAKVAGEDAAIGTLVLWDPCGSGREFLREQSALFRLNFGKSQAAKGSTEVPGYVFTEQTAKDLTALTAPTSLPHVDRALILSRTDRAPAGTFGIAEDRIEREAAEGQAELMDVEPFFSEVPPTTERIAAWLSAALPTAPTGQAPPEPRSEMVLTNGAGVTVTERVVELGPVKLFGIEATSAATGGRPVVLFLNSGNDPHVGPNRMWVDFSRAWAGLGFRCIRFDLSGLGDSPVRTGQPENVPRASEAFDDVADVVGNVVGPADVPPVVLVGLCSGAYQALESASHIHPQAVVAINPVLRFEAPETKTGSTDPRRRLYQPAGNLTQAYRALPSWKVLRLARRGYLFASRHLSRGPTSTDVLKEMAHHGTNVICVCGEEEADSFFSGGRPEGERIVVDEHAAIDVIDGLDHALIPEWHRRRVMELVTGYVLEQKLDDAAATVGAGDDPEGALSRSRP